MELAARFWEAVVLPVGLVLGLVVRKSFEALAADRLVSVVLESRLAVHTEQVQEGNQEAVADTQLVGKTAPAGSSLGERKVFPK